jgi:hypothetical protein
MSKLLVLAAVGTDAVAVAAQDAVALDATPFLPGFNVLAHVVSKGLTGAPVIKIQESADEAFTTPVDLAATSGILTDDWIFEITPTLPYIRAAVTAGAGAGDFSAYLTAGGAP